MSVAATLTEARLKRILARFKSRRVLVVGDIYLDRYVHLDKRLSEVSLETGLEAHQVVRIENAPGHGGTVINNLRALGVPTWALCVIGADGHGQDLTQALKDRGVRIEAVLQSAARFTPAYIKLILHANGKAREITRLDVKNRKPMGPAWEARVIQTLRKLVPRMDAVIVADQTEERNCGVITTRVRMELQRLSRAHPKKFFLVDSRMRIGEYRDVLVKPNEKEARRAAGATEKMGAKAGQGTSLDSARHQIARKMAARVGRPVFMTLGEDGMLLAEPKASRNGRDLEVGLQNGVRHMPAIKVKGPLDICGAGDSTTAGIVAALASGASLPEAAAVGQLVASITIQQLGTTGTATATQVLKRFRETARR